MNTAVGVESRIARVDVNDEMITAYLVDGRVISVPLAWSWRLSEATPAQRANWQLIGEGHGVHWPRCRRGYQRRRHAQRCACTSSVKQRGSEQHAG